MPFATSKPSHSAYHIRLRVSRRLWRRLGLKVSNNFFEPLKRSCKKFHEFFTAPFFILWGRTFRTQDRYIAEFYNPSVTRCSGRMPQGIFCKVALLPPDPTVFDRGRPHCRWGAFHRYGSSFAVDPDSIHLTAMRLQITDLDGIIPQGIFLARPKILHGDL